MFRAIYLALVVIVLGGAATAALLPLSSNTAAQPAPASRQPDEIIGPFFADPDVMALLDRTDPSGDCRKSGKLAFGCLIQARGRPGVQPTSGALANPFNLRVTHDIVGTIKTDLDEFASKGGQQISEGFLTDHGSRLELVGIINRSDRSNGNRIDGSSADYQCGEISLIYRFRYQLMVEGTMVSSRLPVTMNVVFPALPPSRKGAAYSCASISGRWLQQLKEFAALPASDSERRASLLQDPTKGIISLLDGRDIDRIELNIQVYRIPAGADKTDFGSTAQYVIRVFRWNADTDKFEPSFLANQIDRSRLLKGVADNNSCSKWNGKPISREAFLAYLAKPAVMSDIDAGTLNMDEFYLACRAVSDSPGGPHRSGNAPFWDAATASEQIMTDAWIERAITATTSPKRQFSYFKTAADFRMRLNELSCSGCHQTRAIAGFHFPGADRDGAHAFNAVFLPGSPHFFGDQPRRMEILERLANGTAPGIYDRAASYASRPLNRYSDPKRRHNLASTSLIGGWGGACLMDPSAGRRNWGCTGDLTCTAVFVSDNAPGLGICAPPSTARQIGDALQFGKITTPYFGQDRYFRTLPAPIGDWKARNRDTTIHGAALPPSPPPGNSYFGAHQEYNLGRAPSPDELGRARTAVLRDQETGGFSGGMLRLSECSGLPPEASCGLVASDGFNDCIAKVADGKKSLEQCFTERTSYAGLRACDRANPCRDDYICLKPLGYSKANGRKMFLARQSAVAGRYGEDHFGQAQPDELWLGRNQGAGDQRGVCIPPYFVFQFRSDKHPRPMVSGTAASNGK